MADPNSTATPPPVDPNEPRVVYRRADSPDGEPGSDRSPGRARSFGRSLAPSVTPLLVGFTLLLIVIFVLGFLSIRKVESVGFAVLDLEQQYAARLSLLLEMRLALTRLNNEARARQQADEGGGVKAPFDLPLRTAREKLDESRAKLDRPSLNESPKWDKFRRDLEDYVKVTEDPRQYSLLGFAKFRTVDTELDELLKEATGTEAEITEKGRTIEASAVRQIRIWRLIALLVSLLVAGGTVWEIQRRFRQMRRSVDETRRERSFSNQMLQGMVSAVAAIDGHDRLRSVNQAFLNIFPGASVGAFIREKFGPDDAMNMLEVATARRTKEAVYCGRWLLGETGHPNSFDVYSSPLEIDGDQGIIVTLVDVTDAAEAERVARRNEALTAVGQATTQLAHEIRNPLGSIRLGVSMLRDNVDDNQDALRTIDLVERGISHLNKLVVDVTQYSRGKPLERTNVDLNDALNRSLDLVADKIQEKQTPLEKRFSQPGPHGVWDPDQLRQVFVNLISNAIDASPEGVAITLETMLVSGGAQGPDGASRTLARIVIADQGSGMDEATRAKVFQPFFSTKKRGTGLGLAIVKQIVEQHEGKISVESEPGKGTRFTIDLPL